MSLITKEQQALYSGFDSKAVAWFKPVGDTNKEITRIP